MVVSKVIVGRAFPEHAREHFLQRMADDGSDLSIHHFCRARVAVKDGPAGIVDHDRFANCVEGLFPDGFCCGNRLDHAFAVKHDGGHLREIQQYPLLVRSEFMRRAIAGGHATGHSADDAQGRNRHIADAFGDVHRKLIGRKLGSCTDALQNADRVSVVRLPGEGAAERSKHRLVVVNGHRETGGGLPPGGLVQQRIAKDTRDVGVHDAAHEFDDCLQCWGELWTRRFG